MNLADYTQVSNFAVTSGMIVVALAFLAYVAEWGFARQVVKEEQPVAVGAGGVPAEPVEQE